MLGGRVPSVPGPTLSQYTQTQNLHLRWNDADVGLFFLPSYCNKPVFLNTRTDFHMLKLQNILLYDTTYRLVHSLAWSACTTAHVCNHKQRNRLFPLSDVLLFLIILFIKLYAIEFFFFASNFSFNIFLLWETFSRKVIALFLAAKEKAKRLIQKYYKNCLWCMEKTDAYLLCHTNCNLSWIWINDLLQFGSSRLQSIQKQWLLIFSSFTAEYNNGSRHLNFSPQKTFSW